MAHQKPHERMQAAAAKQLAALKGEQPIRPRFDGASAPMPKLRGSRDEFHTLRNNATNNGRYGRKR